MNNQCQRVLTYMEDNGSIEPLQAWQDIGVYRLASRISDLKLKHGVPVVKSMVKTLNQFGEPVKFARYSLGGDA